MPFARMQFACVSLAAAARGTSGEVSLGVGLLGASHGGNLSGGEPGGWPGRVRSSAECVVMLESRRERGRYVDVTRVQFATNKSSIHTDTICTQNAI